MSETELDTGRRIAAGDLPSPQIMPGFAIFSLRFSGTGTAWREAHQEHVLRPPEQFLTPEMCSRIAGVPVVTVHPAAGHLNSDTYAQTVIGAICFGYVADASGVQSDSGNELWCIARINDADAANAMASGEFSTSPAVIFTRDSGNETISLQDGTHMLCEGRPAVIDHLAACIDAGVWDKDGPVSGIRTDSTGVNIMPTEEEMAADKARKDAEEARWSKLDKFMDSVTSRLDAVEAANKPDVAAAASAAAAGNPPGAPVEVAADAETERQEEALKADAQSRADSVASMFGEQAPRPLSGERLLAYRKRLLNRFKSYSKDFKGVDIHTIADAKVFDVIEGQIYADAAAASNNPIVAAGMLRDVVRVDPETGHRTRTFYGDPEACWGEFKSPSRRARINLNGSRAA